MHYSWYVYSIELNLILSDGRFFSYSSIFLCLFFHDLAPRCCICAVFQNCGDDVCHQNEVCCDYRRYSSKCRISYASGQHLNLVKYRKSVPFQTYSKDKKYDPIGKTPKVRLKIMSFNKTPLLESVSLKVKQRWTKPALVPNPRSLCSSQLFRSQLTRYLRKQRLR